MIRDPSDGSVRERAETGIPASKGNQSKPLSGLTEKPDRPVLEIGTSGLQTGSQKPENIARLERSREQLKRYHETGKWNDRGSSDEKQSVDGQAATGLRPDREGLEQPGDSQLAGDQPADG